MIEHHPSRHSGSSPRTPPPAGTLPALARVLIAIAAGLALMNGQTMRSDACASEPTQAATGAISGITDLRKGPYLIFPGDNTTMQVLWQALETTTCTLAWGTSRSYELGSVQTTEYGDDHQHSYLIENLVPGQRYVYEVTAAGTSYPGSFVAALADGATAVKLMVHGDIQTGPATHDALADSMITTYTNDPDFQSIIIGTGDIANFGDVEADWDNLFFNRTYTSIRERMANVPFQTNLGNHELYTSSNSYNLDATIFKKYFPYPFVNDRYWSFDYGPIHVVMVDLYPWYYQPGLPDNIHPGNVSPEQAQWIEDDLAATTKPWKFMVYHAPAFSAGPHPNNASAQDTLQPLCEAYGVDLVFSGHNHYYAHALVNDVHHITTGGGGANLYWPNPNHGYLLVTDRSHHVCKIHANGNWLDFEAVSLDGEIIDQFTLMKQIGIRLEAPLRGSPALLRSHPNPFELSTSIIYDGPVAGRVRLAIYDVRGRRIRTLLDRRVEAGRLEVEWNGRDDAGTVVAAGVYFYRLQAEGSLLSRRLVLLQ